MSKPSATSKRTLWMLEGNRRGYKILEDGRIVNPSGGVIAGYLRSDGYITISCKIDGRSISFYAHRLAAFQKYGNEMFREGMEVRHLDGNPSNNAWSNIAIGTHSQNMMDMPSRVRVEKATKASHSNFDQSRWFEVDVDRDSGMSYRQLEVKHGIATSTLSFRYGKAKRELTLA